MVAYWMAKYACASHETVVFNYPICRDFLFILAGDSIGRTLERRVA